MIYKAADAYYADYMEQWSELLFVVIWPLTELRQYSSKAGLRHT